MNDLEASLAIYIYFWW